MEGAKYVTVSIVRGTFWWTIPNIPADSYFEITIDDTVPVVVRVPIPKGLYSYTDFISLIKSALTEAAQRSDAVTFVANMATQHLDLQFHVNASLRFGTEELAIVCGFAKPKARTGAPESKLEGAHPWDHVWSSTHVGAGHSLIAAPFHARFDTVQYLQVASDIVDTGFYVNNGQASNVIAQIMINVSAGTQIVYEPSVPLEVATSRFSSSTGSGGVTRARFILYDQDMTPCDTMGQTWTILLRLKYFT